LGIYYTTNSGQDWTQSSRTTGNFYSVSLSGSNGIAGSNSPASGIYYTTDSGINFTQSTINT
jgi:hypothetical protein